MADRAEGGVCRPCISVQNEQPAHQGDGSDNAEDEGNSTVCHVNLLLMSEEYPRLTRKTVRCST